MSREDVIQSLDATIEEERKKAHDEGFRAGETAAARRHKEEIDQIKGKWIDQGRANALEGEPERLAAAREEGRQIGVIDGKAQAEAANEKRIRDDAFKQGKAEGDREGFKRGRGEGYKAGWNDAITTPPAAQKPR